MYGDKSRVSLLSKANPKVVSPTQTLAKGTEVRVPRYLDYVVKPGDALGGIAKDQLGDPMAYMEIFEANKDKLSSPTAIEAGMRLRIPLLRD